MRARVRALLAITVLAALAFVAGTVYLSRYSPLEPGSTFAPGKYLTLVPYGQYYDRAAYRFAYHAGARTSFAYSLRNGGRLPVKITQVGGPDDKDVNTLFRILEVRLPRESRHRSFSADPAESEPFHSFVLDQGEERGVLMVGRLEDCKDFVAGGLVTTTSFRVEFSVFGYPRSQWVDVPARVVAVSPRRCPRRRASG